MPALCRICQTETTHPPDVCDSCGGEKIVSHAELNDLSTAHIDCDSFYASVEKRDTPQLADKPVLVMASPKS